MFVIVYIIAFLLCICSLHSRLRFSWGYYSVVLMIILSSYFSLWHPCPTAFIQRINVKEQPVTTNLKWFTVSKQQEYFTKEAENCPHSLHIMAFGAGTQKPLKNWFIAVARYVQVYGNCSTLTACKENFGASGFPVRKLEHLIAIID